MRHSLRTYLRRKVTFMFVPHEGGKPAHWKVQLPLVHLGFVLLGGVLLWALVIVGSDHRDTRLLDQARHLKARMAEIQSEVKENRETLERIAKAEAEFRRALRLKGGKKAAALGGPTEEDSDQLTELLREKDGELLDRISSGLKEVNQEALHREASFREIQVQLDKQSSLLAATPNIWPVKGWITSGFGKRMSPLTGEPGRHMGVDIANGTNTPIRATADGLVTYAGWQAGYGRVVVIEHGYGYGTRYGHCARVNVKVGDEVKRGHVIGYIGSTGRSTGSHCHYEVRLHGVPVDPEKYLPALN